MADGDYISNASDLDRVFGRINIQNWADADNEDDKIQRDVRIDWANEYAEQEFLGRLADGPYDHLIVRTTKPKMAILICTCIAGIHLYDTRRVIDSSENTDRVAKQRKNADRWIRQIMAGQLKLIDPSTRIQLTKTAQNSPFVVDDADWN